ncbi:MAG: hypothetical protein LIO75_04350 [Lachnospiraceae bacterium]|nr:hypothetical protein [Lachnospiraceae bacterium]
MDLDIKETEGKLEQGVKAFHQYIYDKLGDALDMDDKLSLLCALAMAGMMW